VTCSGATRLNLPTLLQVPDHGPCRVAMGRLETDKRARWLRRQAPEADWNVWQAVSGGHYYRFKIASHPISDTRTSLQTFEPGLCEKNSDIEKSRSETPR
jgi:hypothetical protein